MNCLPERLATTTLNLSANQLDALERYEEALAAHDQAIRLDPKDALAYGNKAFALLKLGRTKEAQDCQETQHNLMQKTIHTTNLDKR